MWLIVKSIVAWVGGKSKLMWIINRFAPKKFDRFLDVFGGSGTVTLNVDAPKNTLKIYNDFNSNLVNLMCCARDRPFALIKEIGFFSLNSRDDFEVCKKLVLKEEMPESYLEEEMKLTEILFPKICAEELKLLMKEQSKDLDIKRASAYYKLLRYSFNANGETFGGRKLDVRRFFVDIWKFSFTFKDVVIENKDFQSLISQYDRETAFIYCDPPYLFAEGFYPVGFGWEDHVRLRDCLKKAKGYVMVSYNNHEKVIELYTDFYVFLTTRPHSMSKKEGEVYEELIITNYNPYKFIEEKSSQINLFGSFSLFSEERDFTIIHKPNKPLKT